MPSDPRCEDPSTWGEWFGGLPGWVVVPAGVLGGGAFFWLFCVLVVLGVWSLAWLEESLPWPAGGLCQDLTPQCLEERIEHLERGR